MGLQPFVFSEKTAHSIHSMITKLTLLTLASKTIQGCHNPSQLVLSVVEKKNEPLGNNLRLQWYNNKLH